MSRDSRRLSVWRGALVLLALLAASAQQLVAQTHWHTPAVVQAGAESAPAPAAPLGTEHDDCLLCQIAAHAAAAAPPAAMPLLVVARDAQVVHVSQVPCLVPIPQPAHAWQSRGPPTA